MKTKLLLCALTVVCPLFAADMSKILLRGESVSVEEARAAGNARAVVGDLSVTADAITFDRQKNALKCEGSVSIRASSAVVTARDCVIELPVGEKRVVFLSRGEIRIVPKPESITTSLVPSSK